MAIAGTGVGTYTEILQTWTLEDYLLWREIEEERGRNRRTDIQNCGRA